MTNNSGGLTNIRVTDGSVEMGDRIIVQILKIETVISTAVADVIKSTVYIEDVSYVPELTTSLLSAICILQQRLDVTFKSVKNNTGIVVVMEQGSGSVVNNVVQCTREKTPPESIPMD